MGKYCKRIVLLFLLLFATNSYAVSPAILHGMSGSSGECVTDNVTFWYRAESEDFSGTNGTLDYSVGDDTAVVASGATFDADASYFASGNGLNLPTPSDYIYFSPPTATMDDAGTIGFWLRLTTFTDTRRLVFLTKSPDDNVIISLSGTEELQFLWKDDGNVRSTLITSGAALSTGTWYFIQVAWETGNPGYREIWVNNVSVGSSADIIGSLDGAPTLFVFGDGTGTAQAGYMDNIILTSTSTDDLYPCRNEEQWPE